MNILCYESHAAGGLMCDLLNNLHKQHKNYVGMNKILERYELPFNEMTGMIFYSNNNNNNYINININRRRNSI